MRCFALSGGYWVDGQGKVRPCCKYLHPMRSINEIEDWSTIPSLPEYGEVRDQLSSGSWPNGCWSCKVDEERGVRSRRGYYDSIGLEDGDAVVEINLGTYCNLRCRMCGPQNSSLWLPDHKALIDKGLRLDIGMDFTPYQPTAEDISRLVRHACSVKGRVLIELKGGEPLIMPQTQEILEGLSRASNTSNMKIMLVTNGTVVPGWLPALASRIGRLELILSMDGLGSVYDYIRGNGRFTWEAFSENVPRFISLPNTDVRCNIVVQNLNMHQLPDMHDWLGSQGITSTNHILLKRPLYLAANVLPEAAKAAIMDRYDGWKTTKDRRTVERMDGLHSFMMTKSDGELGERFVRVSRFLDQRRGQDLFSSLTHLDEWRKYDMGLEPDGTAMP